MNDPLGVRCVQPIGNLNGQRKQSFVLHTLLSLLAGNPMPQRDAVQKLHGDKRLIAMLANVVNRADVGMVESRRGTSFTPKAFQCLRVSGNIVG